jgi:predicted RNA-binding protein YlqC (UPF0109 family)
MDYKELVVYMVKSLVDHPDEVSINEIEGEKSTILELRVVKEDIGKVIGKHGRIARAIRTIINASATKTGKRVVLEILD